MKSKSKYFVANTRDEAVQSAQKYFQCEIEDLLIEEIQKESTSDDGLALGVYIKGQDEASIKNRNGSFALYFEEDGVFLEIYRNCEKGEAYDDGKLRTYVLRKALEQLDAWAVQKLQEVGQGRVKIAPPQKEMLLREDISIKISADNMQVTVTMEEPDLGGEALSLESAKNKIKEAGITHGILEKELEQVLAQKKYGEPCVVAVGKSPIDGEDGYLVFHFRKETVKGPKVMENEKVDYRSLDLFEAVAEGQLLVTRHLAVEGTPGYTVRGRELKAREGKEINMPQSKNTIVNDDQTTMHAKTSGMVEIISQQIVVSNIFTVKGDCDMGIGNIDFDGSVVIQGNVISGLLIKATGSITIGGVLEGSEIIAGGNVELKRGVQGMDKGKITAGGSVTALFIERAIVVAKETVTADAIIHSTIEAGKSLYVKGKRGSIIGGQAFVTGEIVAQTIGSVSTTPTEIEVGLTPVKRKHLQFLQGELARTQVELEKLEKLEVYLTRSQQSRADQNRENLRESVVESKRQNTQLLAQYNEELNRALEEADHAIDGKVHVKGTVYPGVRVAIGNAAYRVESPIPYATFEYSDGEIVFTACEVGG